MISSQEALALVLKNTLTKPPARVPIELSHGLVLAQGIVAGVDAPGFDNSAMDGFAVRASDLEGATAETAVELRVTGSVGAGAVHPSALARGECLQIMTGAPIPSGADAVVMKEDVSLRDQAAIFHGPTIAGENVRFRGEDIRVGDSLLAAGEMLSPARLGLLASQGMAEVLVIPRASVGIVATGDELVLPGGELGPGKIYDSNSTLLSALVKESHAQGHVVGVAKDSKGDIAKKFHDAMAFDVVVVAGGVSVGTFDYVKDVFGEEGVEEIFWRVKIKPGMPFFAGKAGSKLVFGVPGNPVSAFVIFQEFIRPALKKIMGHQDNTDRTEQAVLKIAVSKRPGKTTFLRGICERENGQLTVRPSGTQGSHSLKSLARANALIVLPEEGGKFSAGDTVMVKCFHG